MNVVEGWSGSPILHRPVVLLSGIGIITQAFGFTIPSGLTAVILSGDFFYYGGTANPILNILNPVQASQHVWNWRPQTTNEQSFHWTTFSVLGQSNYLEAAVTDGQFDVLVCGLLVPGEIAIPQ